MTFKHKNDGHRYPFLDQHCIGRECWAPGLLVPDNPCCLTHAERGCPDGPVDGLPAVDPQLAAKRKADGWRQAGF